MSDPLTDLARLEGVPSAVAAALDSVDAVLRDRGLREMAPEVVATALLAGARATAGLTDAPDRWLPGAVRLSAELVELAAVVRVAPAQALARAHVLLARGLVTEDRLGRVDPGVASTARLAGVTDLLSRATTASAVVLGAVVHAELATAALFGSGDALLGRAAEHLVLISAGVDPRGVIPVEAGHADAPAAYRSALQAYAGGSFAGVRAWIVHCAGALARGAELSPARG